MSSPEARTEFVLRTAEELGFARAGVTNIETPAHYDDYRAWLDRGDHGSMGYMDDDFHKQARRDMRELLPSARSAIVVALSYSTASPEPPQGDEAPAEARGRVAQYALGDDYHHVIKKKLGQLAERLAEQFEASESRACVDSAPVLERELAERAGLGFIAKNTMLITPGLGSYTLLGVLLTSAELATTPNTAPRDCGTCTACIDACPTQAFRGPHKLDARRCISYLTIESQEPMPEELRSLVGDRIFGCDVCQDVCPYNAAAPARASVVPELMPRDAERARPSLAMLAALGSNQRKRYVAGNAMRRNRREQLLRNVAVALGNSNPSAETVDTLAGDRNPMVQEHALWARAQRTTKS
tara:strand:- start:38525 stop:39592 length:1068 start_codon:yes stop_codon:yes gene_type:complete